MYVIVGAGDTQFMHKKLYFDKEVLSKTLTASSTLAKHVGATMGPTGRNVLIKNIGYPTTVTQDGVTVARSIVLKDEAENSVADVIKLAAIQLEELVGDGTTTVTVLIDAILQEANKLMVVGFTPDEIVNGMEAYSQKVAAFIEENKIEVDLEKLIRVASISAKNEAIGKLVAETVYSLGATATVTTQESATGTDSVDTLAGFEIPFGWISHYMAPTREVSMENPHVIVCDMPLRDKQDVLPILKALNEDKNKSAVIFARQIGGEALSMLVINKLKKVVDVVAIEISDRQIPASDIFQDLSITTGAKIISRSNGKPVDSFQIEDAGAIDNVIVGKEQTTLIGYRVPEEDVNIYVQTLKEIKTKNKLEEQTLKQRAAQIESKVANIHVGGRTPSEIQERMFRVDDAIGAAKTALNSGIVLGGGWVFDRVSTVHEPSMTERALAVALRAPQARLAANGATDLSSTYLNENGVYDPLGTLTECLQTAVSTAKVLLLAGSMIMESDDEDKTTK